jgi:hypothetical protein
MEGKTSYLVIWQLGNNNQSIENTPIDVDITACKSADDKYDKIVQELGEDKYHNYHDITILGIYKL